MDRITHIGPRRNFRGAIPQFPEDDRLIESKLFKGKKQILNTEFNKEPFFGEISRKLGQIAYYLYNRMRIIK